MEETALWRLLRAIAARDVDLVSELLAHGPALARSVVQVGASRAMASTFYLSEINHYVYAGDTALHVAAAAHQPDTARRLIAAGADPSAGNRRRAQPLHYAADGVPGSPQWRPTAQAETIACLIAAGADPNAADQGGATALHRAVRTRCAAAVGALLDGGADPSRVNGGGSTPMQLAARTTGRGGSGSAAAKAEQARILALLRDREHRA